MANYVLTRFVSPNASVIVSELGPDLSTTADLGKAVHNFDVNGMRINGANAMTAAGSITGVAGTVIDMSSATVTTGLLVPHSAGAAPLANGVVAFDDTKGSIVTGSNGGTASYANSTQYGVSSVGAVSLTTSTGSLAADMTSFTGPTNINNCSLTLAAGTWLVSANLTFNSASAFNAEARIWDNSATTYLAGAFNGAATAQGTISMVGVVTLGGSTTVFLEGASTASGTVRKQTSNNSWGPATYIHAVRIA